MATGKAQRLNLATEVRREPPPYPFVLSLSKDEGDVGAYARQMRKELCPGAPYEKGTPRYSATSAEPEMSTSSAWLITSTA